MVAVRIPGPTIRRTPLPARRPLPQPYYRVSEIARPSLAQFVFLSMLLHGLFIMLFGAPSGGSREGRAMWGALNVLLADPVTIPGPSLRLDRGLGAELPRVAPAERPPGAREPAPAPPRPATAVVPPPPLELSPAKEITPPRVTPEARPATPPAIPAPPVESAPPPEPRVEPLPVQPLFAPIPKLDRTVIPELKPEILPSAPPAPPEAPALPAAEPLPSIQPTQLERPMPPRVELPPAEAPPVPAPLVQPVPPAPVERPPSPVERIPTPPVEKAPVQAPVVPVPPLEPITPARDEPSSRPQESAVPREQLAVPPPLPAERTEPRAPERTEPRPSEPPARADPALRAPRAPAGTPTDRGSEIFTGPRAAPPAASDPGTGPRGIDLDAARKRARELAVEGSGQRAVFPFLMPAPPPEYKSKEAIAIEKARKPDCKTAYKDLGLLAVVPLIANEFGEGNCRW